MSYGLRCVLHDYPSTIHTVHILYCSIHIHKDSPVSLVELYLMHLSCAGSRPHEESRRRPGTVRVEVVPPLDACAVEVLPHELGLSKATVTQLLWCSVEGMLDDI